MLKRKRQHETGSSASLDQTNLTIMYVDYFDTTERIKLFRYNSRMNSFIDWKADLHMKLFFSQ